MTGVYLGGGWGRHCTDLRRMPSEGLRRLRMALRRVVHRGKQGIGLGLGLVAYSISSRQEMNVPLGFYSSYGEGLRQ